MSPSPAAGVGTPSSASKLSSSFNTQARDEHARKEQEELARKVKIEQARKKDAQVRTTCIGVCMCYVCVCVCVYVYVCCLRGDAN